MQNDSFEIELDELRRRLYDAIHDEETPAVIAAYRVVLVLPER